MTWRNQAWRFHLKHWAVTLGGFLLCTAIICVLFATVGAIDYFVIQTLGLR